jgi:hypothetical protein
MDWAKKINQNAECSVKKNWMELLLDLNIHIQAHKERADTSSKHPFQQTSQRICIMLS